MVELSCLIIGMLVLGIQYHMLIRQGGNFPLLAATALGDCTQLVRVFSKNVVLYQLRND
ncbi:MAG: hypothetical protein OXI60_09075 [Acidiferrobacterales bacterium]|nr:hypothetical protein [Acidiferrobacterales bacterium]